MRPRAVLAAIAALVFAPALALAQEPVPPTGGDWSLGAGVTFFTTFTATATIGFPLINELNMPAADASLERRISPRTWLVLGVFGAVTQQQMDPPFGSSRTQQEERWLTFTGGVRRVLTAPGAPVDFSLLFLAQAGYADIDVRFVGGGVEERAQATGWSAGGRMDLAIDRVLTGGLSLRIASPILTGSWNELAIEEEGVPDRDGDGFTVGALIAPRLELRLAF
jgi:hypothetical protein